jgi:recombination protein RecT
MNLRPAATVMLLRAAAFGVEVFMLRRSSESAFLPDAYVFPGGTLDAQDVASCDHLPGVDLVRFHDGCTLDRQTQRALVATAVREVCEECGVIFADAGVLTLFSHWVTPESERRRYDVHFFLTRLPAGQHPVADATETHDGLWVAPNEALARGDRGSLLLIYPTRKHLERLAQFQSIDELLSFARSKPIHTVLAPLTESLEGLW